MWVEKSGNKYRACAYYVDPLTLTRHKVGVTFDKNTAQQRNRAKQELDSLIFQKSNYAPRIVTLGDLVTEYRLHQKKTVKASTYNRNHSVCNAFLSIFGTGSDVNRLTARIINSRLLSYTDNPVTYNEYVARLKALLRWGYRNDLIRDISYLEKLDKLKDRTPKEKVADKFLERSECEKLIESMQIPEWKLLTELLLLSGLRIGEALALELSDIDLQNHELSVSKTLDPNSMQVTSPKTRTSSRIVYMQDDLTVLCASLIDFATRKRTALGLDTLLLFFDYTGGYAHYDAYRKYLRENAERSIGRPITPHVLRHTHASLLTEHGIPFDLISRRLGHSNSRITRDIYIHITEQKQKQDNAMLKSVSIL